MAEEAILWKSVMYKIINFEILTIGSKMSILANKCIGKRLLFSSVIMN